ncbi:unnamed protein product [Urochloa humidicola]
MEESEQAAAGVPHSAPALADLACCGPPHPAALPSRGYLLHPLSPAVRRLIKHAYRAGYNELFDSEACI